MKVSIVSEVAKDFYYYPIKRLYEDGKIDSFEIESFRTFRPIFKNVAAKLGLVKGREQENITSKEFLVRLFIPVRYFFKDTIIVGLEPYDVKVVIPLFWKLLGKHVIYYTSWPYWQGINQPRTGIPGSRLLWKLFLRDLKVVAVTDSVKDSLLKFQPNARVFVIPHPVDLEKFKPKNKKNRRLKVITLARLVPQKGVLEFASLAKDFPDADFIIASGGGPLEHEVKKLAKRYKNLKYVSDKDRWETLRGADIFVLNSYKIPGWEELFGMVLIEAMASGVPVIATNCIGPRGVIEESATGYLVPQRDSQDLKLRLGELMSNADLRTSMGKKAREVCESVYNLDSIYPKWEEALKR